MPGSMADAVDATHRIGTPVLIPPPAVVALGRTVGRFRVERELGRGGMSVVLLARDLDLNRPVALKFLRADDPEAVARFRLEANALAGLSHPNAVRVYEVGVDAGRPYLALEYVPGESLAAAARGGAMAPRRAAELLAAVADAAHAAHAAGVLHRDLKPANVLLAADGEAKLTDFGLARRLDLPAGLTDTGAAVGTPNYMAPEQVRGGRPDARTDVYGLGATLYECLTGRPPFAGPVAAVFEQVQHDDPVPPRRLNRGVPADLETIALKCLEKHPAARYPTAAAVADDLRRFLAGRAIAARPVGPTGRAWRWGRRNKPLAAAGLAAVLSLAVGAAAAGWEAVQATRARDAEAAQRRRADDQAAEAVAARRDAEAKADEADAINRFLLVDLLKQASSTAQADGRHKPDPNLTVRAALDRAADAVGERFADRPQNADRVRLALADAYHELGEYAKAADQYRRVLDSFRGRHGPDHRETLSAAGRLGRALAEGGRKADALPLYEDRLARSRRALGPTDPGTLVALAAVALAYSEAGRHADAAPLLEEAVARYREAEGPDGKGTLAAVNNLALGYFRAGRRDEAVARFREVADRRERAAGPAHPQTLHAVVNLASALSATGRAAEAVPVLAESVRVRREVLGPDHPVTTTGVTLLAEAYGRAGRPADAVPLFEESVRLRRGRLGPDHPDALMPLHNLGCCLHKAGRSAEAVPVHEECLARRRRALGPTHRDTLATLGTLGGSLRGAGRHAEAVAAGEECLALSRQALGPADPDTLVAMHVLAKAYLSAGRRADAARLAEDLLARRAARTPPDPLLAAARELLGGCRGPAETAPRPRPAS